MILSQCSVSNYEPTTAAPGECATTSGPGGCGITAAPGECVTTADPGECAITAASATQHSNLTIYYAVTYFIQRNGRLLPVG